MLFKEIVVEEAVIPVLAATKRDDAIAELVDALVAAGTIAPSDRDEYYKKVLARERKGSTGFGHGVAVPHVKSPDIHAVAVAIGISPGGVEFNALDRKPVHSIFLLMSPESDPDVHLHLEAMELIFGHLRNERFRNFLRQANSVEDVRTLLEEADASRPTT
ncbi:MAG: PTS sugar transporter subunit IIA [Phycisphaerales bacterium]|jgi:mannitol/fructose-specific phosphotransferase system IIA component (Ntr-type)